MLLSLKGVGQTLNSNAVLNTICSGDNFNIQMSFNQRITFFLEYNLNDGSGWNVYNNLSVTSSNANPSLYTFPAISLPLVSSVSIVDFRIRYSIGTTYLAGSSTTTSILLSITDNPLPNATVATNNTICNGVSINIGSSTVSGSTYSWSSSAGSYSSTSSNPIVNPSITQTYSLTETITATGCNNSNSVLINVNARPTATITNTNTTICEGANEIVYVNVTAVGNWTLTVNDGGSVNGIGSGVQPFVRNPNVTKNYFIVAALDANCSSNLSDLSGTWTITVNPTPTVAVITSQIKCNSIASDVINFSGTVSGTTYAWTNSQSSIGIPSSGNGTISSTTLTNSTASPIIGIFTITPTANSCPGPVGTFTITVNPTPTIAAITPQVRCNTIASDVINFSGTVTGTTYAWTNSQSSIGIAANGSGTISSTILTNSTSSPIVGIFTVTPTANSCPGPVGTFSITVNPTPTVAAITPQIKCNAIASDVINFSGTVTGTTYAWTNSQSSIGIAASGSGTVTSTTLTNLTTSPVISAFSVTPTANSCAGPVGTFSITVNPTPAKPTLTNQIICEGVTATITGPTGTYTYTWQVPTGLATSTTNTINTSKAGTYSLTITDANSCTSEVGTGTVTVNPLPTKPTLTNSTICEGAMATITGPTGTYAYTWQVPTGVATSTTNTINTSKAGTYSLTITDANSCTSEVGTGTVTVNPLPTKPALTSSIICEGATATITGPTGVYTYTWTVPTGVATSTTKTIITTKAGTYSLTITDVNSCSSEVGTATVTVNPLPAKPTVTSSTICEGATATITGPSGVYTYTWQVPTGVATSTTKTISTTKAGTYSLIITDINSCTSEVGTGTVTVNPLPVKPTLTSSAICEGQSTTVSMSAPSGIYTYTWQVPTGVASSTTNTVITSKEGNYSLIITDANSCKSEVGTATVIVNALPAKPIVTSPTICEGQTATITSPAGVYTYTWQVPAGVLAPGNVNTFTTTKAGTYSLIIVNNKGCNSAVGSGVVTVNTIPLAPLISSNSPVEEEKTLNLTASNLAGATYAWSGPNGFTSMQQNPSIIANLTNAGSYYATVTLNGCTSVSSMPIVVLVTPRILTSPVFQIPNAFTPNSDGHNDTFKIIENGYVTSIIGFKIFTKSGKLIFSDKDGAWDGRYAGVMLDSDVYIWIADFINKNNIQEHLSGTVLLLK